ncbi:MAG: hypothetical protein HYZ42_05785 [Bacteroidetes bacterium]|nr:hypothetical protein [Bacteroidota bacterium]
MKQIILFATVSILAFSSCSERTPKNFQVEIICDQPFSEVDKFPDYFEKILTPNEFNEDNFIVPKPIKVRRVDLGNSLINIEAFAFESIAD